MSSGKFDIVISGAGMVGACAALALAGQGYRVAIIEAVPPRDSDKVNDEADNDLSFNEVLPDELRHSLNGPGYLQKNPSIKSNTAKCVKTTIYSDHRACGKG